MIDVHAHILPDIDDGSRSATQSLRILKTLKDAGVEKVIATPHFSLENFTVSEFIEKRQEALNKINAIKGDAPVPEIILGAEVYLSHELSKTENLSALCIGDSPYLLIEMPYFFWSAWVFDELKKIIEKHKLIPIIAHLERYYYLKVASLDKILALFEENVLAQMNADSLCNKRQRKIALALAKNNYVQFLGSDVHNEKERRSRLPEARRVLKRRGCSQILDEMDSFAEKLVENKPIKRGKIKKINKIFSLFY